VLYQPGPEIKLVDFGIAKVEALELTATGEFIGTPSYMSPEIFSGERVDGRSDLFSLGVILYQLLTGERPFEATTVSRTIYRVLHDEPTPPSRVRPGISPLWDIVCARLLAKKPDDRYRSARALIADLDSLERGTLVGQEPTQPIPSTRPPRPWPLYRGGAHGRRRTGRLVSDAPDAATKSAQTATIPECPVWRRRACAPGRQGRRRRSVVECNQRTPS
jgi:serine/threonine-protein kinase